MPEAQMAKTWFWSILQSLHLINCFYAKAGSNWKFDGLVKKNTFRMPQNYTYGD
jgi:hypothetical protein